MNCCNAVLLNIFETLIKSYMCHKNPFNVTLYRVLSCHYICNVFLNYYIAKKQSGGRITQFAIKGYMAICTCGFCKTYPVIVLKECKLIQIVRINFLSVSGLILYKNYYC